MQVVSPEQLCKPQPGDRFPDWAAQGDALTHRAEELVATCGICRGIAAYHNVNLEPPSAP